MGLSCKMDEQFLLSPTFKLILLTAMVLQNSSTVLVGRHTRSSVPAEELYVVNHVIMCSEIGKLLLSCVLEFVTTNGQLVTSIRINILDHPKDALKILIPALLYLLQNSLLYVALSNLTAPIFQVTYQAKLVTTAIVSVAMLNRKYSPQQWVCLVCLSIGVAIVVLGESKPDDSGEENNANNSSGSPAGTTIEQSLFKGLCAVTIACLSSALAGVYFEKVVKTSSGDKQSKPVSVWMRNIQLAGFTIILAFVQNLYTNMTSGSLSSNKDEEVIQEVKSYFHGFTAWVWLLVLLQSGGGLLVAAIIKYADNVLKGLATGVSVCFATACSTFFFHTTLSGQFTVGAAMILVSVYFFSNPINKSKVDTCASPSAATARGLSPLATKGSSSSFEQKTILPK